MSIGKHCYEDWQMEIPELKPESASRMASVMNGTLCDAGADSRPAP
jgi:hypothetical protein